VLGSPHSLGFNDLVELVGGNLALGASFGGGVTLVNVTANGTNKLFHNYSLLYG
jgi:hypothetical protein